MKIAIVDIETTGFLPKGLIVEVGITELCLETGETKIIYNELVNEGLNDSHKNAWIFQNSDLKFEHALAAKPLDINNIQAILDCYRSTAFNKKFDFTFLRAKGIDVIELPCAMYSASNTVCAKNKNGHAKAPNVQEAWNHFFPNSEYVELHRGADDSMHEAKIVYELYKIGKFDVNVVCD